MTEKELRHLKRAELETLKQGSPENVFTPEVLEQLKSTIRETIQEINGDKP